MPSQNDDDDLRTFVGTLDAETLSGILIEFARENESVRKRLDRLKLATQPRALAAMFRATLAGWRRSTRFISYRESHDFGRELQAWLGQVEQELLPRDPAQALALAEGFIGSDAKFFERADDSDGCISDAVREGCRLWLRAAAKCKPPAYGWTERLFQLAKADDYGARGELLRSADLLLNEAALRDLAERFNEELIAGINLGVDEGRLPPSVFSASGSLHLVSQALRDPDVHVHAVLRYSPQPNAMQRQEFARAYLGHERAEDALRWLDSAWAHMEGARLRLRAEALAKLGRIRESAAIRMQLFDGTGDVFDYRAWLELLPTQEHPAARAHAHQRAWANSDPVLAACLLLELGDAADAETILVEGADRIDGERYGQLVPLAQTLESQSLMRGATACYRALLMAILARAYARAYGHAARYFKKLAEIAGPHGDLRPLLDHPSFEAAVRSKHARKIAFWSYVEGKRALPTTGTATDDLNDDE